MNIGSYILTNLVNGILGIILLILGYKLFDISTPKFKFVEMFKKDKVTNGSIIVGSFIIGLAIIIGLAAN